MSALVAYQSYLRRVTPIAVTTPVRTDGAAAATAPTSASASVIAAGGSSAASTLLALLGRTGLWGPDGTTTDSTASASPASASPAEARTKLQQALSTLLDALDPRAGRQGTASPTTATTQDSAATATPAVDDAIRTILGALAPVPQATTAATATATVNTDASGQTVAAPAQKPNLDALNRVLAHYTAQSAAASTVVTLVR